MNLPCDSNIKLVAAGVEARACAAGELQGNARCPSGFDVNSARQSCKSAITPDNARIIVSCHKACPIPADSLLLPVHSGAAISSDALGFQRDDALLGRPCPNISPKNGSYCELTAAYWAWKNIRDIVPGIKLIGLCHYRRFFDFGGKGPHGRRVLPVGDVPGYRVDASALGLLLSRADLVLSRRRFCSNTLFADYAVSHSGIDARALIATVHELTPSFDDAVFRVFMRGNAMSAYNMFVMRWDDFAEYCQWLFAILEEVEARVNIEHYDDYQKRIFGYMGERLLNVWVDANGLRSARVPVLQYESREDDRSWKKAARFARNNVVFAMTKVSEKAAMNRFDRIIGSDARGIGGWL